MSGDRPEIKWMPADPRHEAFFSGIVRLSIDLKLRDEEVAALAGKMLGYNRAYKPSASSTVAHLVNVFRQNMRRGTEQVQSGEVKPGPNEEKS